MQRLAACMLGGCLADIPCVVFIRFVTQSSAIAGLRKRDRRAINSCALNRNFFFRSKIRALPKCGAQGSHVGSMPFALALSF